jgi:hypothetical protein
VQSRKTTSATGIPAISFEADPHLADAKARKRAWGM